MWRAAPFPDERALAADRDGGAARVGSLAEAPAAFALADFVAAGDSVVGEKAVGLCYCSAWAASSSDVADISSEALAFCCVTLSSCWIAWLI